MEAARCGLEDRPGHSLWSGAWRGWHQQHGNGQTDHFFMVTRTVKLKRAAGRDEFGGIGVE